MAGKILSQIFKILIVAAAQNRSNPKEQRQRLKSKHLMRVHIILHNVAWA